MAAAGLAKSAKDEGLLFVGTQGDAAGQGIFAGRLDEATGAVTLLGLTAEVARPTWLLADPVRPVLHAVSELGNAGDRDGELFSFAVDPDRGALQQLTRLGAAGGGPTHLALDPSDATMFVANYGGGQAVSVSIRADGAMEAVQSVQAGHGSGPHRRQQGPHAHGVTLDPSGRFLLVPDMGADRIFVYRFDPATRALSPADTASVELPSGSGPRLLLFGPSGTMAYLLTELSAEIYVFTWDAEKGRLRQTALASLDPADVEGQRSAAAFALSSSGRTLYASNRRTDMIHVFAVDLQDGRLTEAQRIAAGGAKPWACEFAPSGKWLLVTNQGSDTIAVFKVDMTSGRLIATDHRLSVPTPTSVAFAQPRWSQPS